MAIPKPYTGNFDTLSRAFNLGHAALMEVRERTTGATRYAVCAVGREGGQYTFTPFALMVDGNPFELFEPPAANGGFVAAETSGG